jgi:hypothetical protein
MNAIENNITGIQHYMELVDRKTDDNNQYARRPNLVLAGMNIMRGENPNSIRKAIINELDRLGIRDAIPDLDRAHRYGSRIGNRQSVIVRFTSWYARDMFYNKRRECKWKLSADLTDRRQILLNNSMDEAASDPSISYVAVDRNSTLYMMSINGIRHDFSSMLEFRNIQGTIADDSCKRLLQFYDFLRCNVVPNEHASCACDKCKGMKFWVNKSTNVINIHDELYENVPLRKYNDIVFIGRGSQWGNKFKGPNCVQEFEADLPKSGLLNKLSDIKSKTLACFCKPNPCHGDCLARLADEV